MILYMISELIGSLKSVNFVFSSLRLMFSVTNDNGC